METILALLASIFHTDLSIYITAIVTIATAILTVFPVPKEGSVSWYVRKALEWLAGNFGHGKKATTDK